MKSHFYFYLLVFFVMYVVQSQDTNIQIYTPSKLMGIGQWDVKWFNNLYTELKKIDEKKEILKYPRSNFFTSSIDVFTGIGTASRWNIGVHLEYRSNTTGGLDLLEPFTFKNQPEQRLGLTRFVPTLKLAPLQRISNFSIQTGLSIPLFNEETLDDVYLDQKGYIIQNKLYYDYSSSNGIFQIFSELGLDFNFGKNTASYANDSLRISPGVFFSYFPNQNLTLLALVQHAALIPITNDFSQNYTALGGGTKYQISRLLNLELLYTNFIRGNSTGLGQTFNLGLRAVIN